MTLLLDTHAAIWLATGSRISRSARAAIDSATGEVGVLVSPVTAWEIGLLVRKQRIQLMKPPREWFETLLGLPGIRQTPLTFQIAIGSSALPGMFHEDPADRLLVATAREVDVPIVTRDRKILDYAETGAVRAIAC